MKKEQWYDRLKQKRLEINKTQADIGSLIGVSERTIIRYGQGEVEEPLPIIRLAIEKIIGGIFL